MDGAAWDEVTAGRNEADLRELAVLPRVLTGATDPELSTRAAARHRPNRELGAVPTPNPYPATYSVTKLKLGWRHASSSRLGT